MPSLPPKSVRTPIVLLAALALPAARAAAQTFDWNSTFGGNFSTASNWTPAGGPPGAGATARFSIANTYGVVFTSNTTVGTFSNLGGDVTFYGNGWTIQATSVSGNGVGATSSSPSLLITNGTFLLASYAVGGNLATTGTLTFDAFSNTTVGPSGSFYVGTSGTGTLVVQAGAKLTTNAATGLGLNASASGTATVTGPGSSWTVSNNPLRVGSSGTGSLSVENGGTVTANALEIGENAGSTGSLSLSGGNATFTTAGTANIGGASASNLAKAATLTVGNAATANLNGTTNLRANATVNVNGGTLNLNTLNVDPGAKVNFSSGKINFASAPAITTPVLDLLLAGTHTISANHTLSATAGTLTLASPLAINGGTLSAPTVDLNANVSVGPFGTLAATADTLTLEPARTLVVEDFGTVAAPSAIVNNGGTLQLNGPLATVTGFTANNAGTVQGTGRFAAGMNIGTGGTVRARAGDYIVIDQAGLTSMGRIELSGGTVEYARTLSNLASGVISGRGEFRGNTAQAPGSSGLANLGTVQLSAGTTDFHGAVLNTGSGKILISGGATVTFFDPVTHNGAELRVSSGSSAVFFGPVTGSGPFTGSGAKFFEAGLSSPAFLATDGSTTVQSPASLTTAYLRESSLTAFGPVALTPDSPTSRLNTLDLSSTGTLDLANNRLILDLPDPASVAATVPQLCEYLRAHRLFSSTADASPQSHLAIGYIDNALLNAPTWGGLPTDTSSLLTRLTYQGDANLDGVINADDYALLDRGFSTHASTWWQGDFDYDRQITSADYLLIDTAYLQQQGGTPSPMFLSQRESQFGAAYVFQLLTSIPEPSSLLTACALAFPLLTRRRT